MSSFFAGIVFLDILLGGIFVNKKILNRINSFLLFVGIFVEMHCSISDSIQDRVSILIICHFSEWLGIIDIISANVSNDLTNEIVVCKSQSWFNLGC